MLPNWPHCTVSATQAHLIINVYNADPIAAKKAPKKADLKKLSICVALGSAIWALPPPSGVGLPAWRLLGIFLGTIAGIITQPLPLGAVAMMGLGAAQMTGVLSFPAAVSAFANEIPWLIAIAFWLSGGFIRSGLGSRIAYSIVSVFGKTTLGLTYSLVGWLSGRGERERERVESFSKNHRVS